MKRTHTVKKRIFLSNALMVLTTLLIFFIINVGIVKLYSELIERELKDAVSMAAGEDGLEELVEGFTIRRDEFLLLFLIDGILCVGVLLLISQIFTKNLARHMMEPLDALSEGAERIKENDLTQEIHYTGEAEFEKVCKAFNDMQRHILEAQEKNRRYEEARTDMIAGISHDLRTPLTAVRGTIKGLMDGVASTPERQQKFLETAYRRTGDMDVLLKQLFYLSKLQTGNMPLSLQSVDLAAFLENYVQSKQELLEGEKLKIIFENRLASGNGGWAAVDPEQLHRILDNLVENSRKYAERKELTVTLTLKRENGKLELAAADNGKGVPEEKLPHIFEEFYRGDESRSRKDGNGLGLYIVKYLTEAMGGRVWAKNQDGLAVYFEWMEEEDGGQKKDSDC